MTVKEVLIYYVRVADYIQGKLTTQDVTSLETLSAYADKKLKEYFMKKFIVAMLILVAFMFVACDNGGDTGGSNGNTQSKSTFTSDTSKGKVTIEVYAENPERAVSSGNLYLILLSGDVIGRGTIVVAGAVWTFQPTYGATESFTGTFSGGTLIIIVIPSPQGPITDFEAEESVDINVVGFWDGTTTIESYNVFITLQFKVDGTVEVSAFYPDFPDENIPTAIWPYSVSGNVLTIKGDIGESLTATIKNDKFTITDTGFVGPKPVTFTRRK